MMKKIKGLKKKRGRSPVEVVEAVINSSVVHTVSYWLTTEGQG